MRIRCSESRHRCLKNWWPKTTILQASTKATRKQPEVYWCITVNGKTRRDLAWVDSAGIRGGAGLVTASTRGHHDLSGR